MKGVEKQRDGPVGFPPLDFEKSRVERSCPCFLCGNNVTINDIGELEQVRLITRDVTFLIRLLLDIPEEVLEDKQLLEEGGQWISTCEECGITVNKAKQAYQEMLEVLRRFKEIQKGIVEGVRKTCVGMHSETVRTLEPDKRESSGSGDLIEKCHKFIDQRGWPFKTIINYLLINAC